MKLVPKIAILETVTTLDIPCERILNAALESTLQKVVVMGYDADGKLYFAFTMANGGDVLWLMEQAKHALLEAREII